MPGFCGNSRLTGVLFLLAACMISGCVKGTSDLSTEEMELFAATQLSISNPLGNIKVTGAEFNNEDGVVFIKTEKYVDAYSLFGFASPNAYLDQVEVTPTMDNGHVKMSVALGPRGFWDRLFVRIVPHVNRIVEAPTAITTNTEVQFGDVELRNLPGNVKTAISVGNVTANTPAGVFGEQYFDIDVGQLNLHLPEKAGFEYDLAVDIGKAEFQDFDFNQYPRIMGVRASGLRGNSDRPGLIAAKVTMGTIAVKAQDSATRQ